MLDQNPLLEQARSSDLIPQIQTTDPTVEIIDRICGAGKTSDMIDGLNPLRQYLIVTPLLTDVQEIIDRAEVSLVQPEARPELLNPDDPNDYTHNKRGHLRDLLTSRENVVCTHKLYSDLAFAAREGWLTGYDIIIDEVPKTSDVLTTASTAKSSDRVNTLVWKNQYLRDNYAVVHDNGQVHPTEKWREDVTRGENTMSETLYKHAEAGCLWASGDTVLIWELPVALLKTGRSITVMAYRFEGSLLQAFMQKHKIEFQSERTPEHRAEEETLRARAKELITVKSIPGLERVKFSARAMEASKLKPAERAKLVNALKRLRLTELKDAEPGSVLVTCLKPLWFKDGKSQDKLPKDKKPQPGPICKQGRKTTGLFNLCRWSANVTRGTNRYRDCNTVLYLYDKHLDPGIAKTLGVPAQGEFNDLFAVSEMVQFVYRSAVRDGKAITLYIPSERMRRLFQQWLDGEI